MVLGLIEFLLGGKKKVAANKNQQQAKPQQVQAQKQQPASGQNSDSSGGGENANQQAKPQTAQVSNSAPASSDNGQRKSVSEVISKIHEELKSTNERVTELVSNVKTIENSVNSFGHRLDDLEESKKIQDEKLGEIDNNMGKFLSLYELINNQYNPFVEKELKEAQEKIQNSQAKEIVLDSNGNSLDNSSVEISNPKSFDDLHLKSAMGEGSSKKDYNDDLDSSLLSLDTLNIEEAAGDAVPLTNLKNNTNSLVIILSWLEYLIKKVGLDETRNNLRYYTEVLRWITPEVYFDLDKYLRGMKDKKDLVEGETLNVRDHIVSLYFISKLNEKALDERLTKAVLQIIKQ